VNFIPVHDNYLLQVMASMGYNVQTNGSGETIVVATAVAQAINRS